MNTIDRNFSTFAMLAALGMILGSLLVLALQGVKLDSPILLGLVSAASSVAGAIGGFSMHRGSSGVNDSPGAQINLAPSSPSTELGK